VLLWDGPIVADCYPKRCCGSLNSIGAVIAAYTGTSVIANHRGSASQLRDVQAAMLAQLLGTQGSINWHRRQFQGSNAAGLRRRYKSTSPQDQGVYNAGLTLHTWVTWRTDQLAASGNANIVPYWLRRVPAQVSRLILQRPPLLRADNALKQAVQATPSKLCSHPSQPGYQCGD